MLGKLRIAHSDFTVRVVVAVGVNIIFVCLIPRDNRG